MTVTLIPNGSIGSSSQCAINSKSYSFWDGLDFGSTISIYDPEFWESYLFFCDRC